MPQQINLNGKNLEFTIKKNRLSRRVRILIHGNGRIVVSAPRFISQKYIKKILTDKSEWITDTLAKCRPTDPKKIPTHLDFAQNKKLATKIVRQTIEKFRALYEFHPKKIFIRNQTTRWGSCSGRGNLSFNFRLVYLPEPLADYLIFHELCHLAEMNHSFRFWALVARAVPDYKKRKAALREMGRRLL
jgi:hypothetical protein